MRSWNVLEQTSQVTLLNGSGTTIRKHKQVPFGTITSLMSKMEEIDFPIGFTDGLEDIYFTYLKRGLFGDFSEPGSIRLSCNNKDMPSLHSTFVHEVGHYVDSGMYYSSILHDEWKDKCHLFKNDHSQVMVEMDGIGVSEYFAIGFERYFTWPEGLCKNEHPGLTEAIQDAIKRWSK